MTMLAGLHSIGHLIGAAGDSLYNSTQLLLTGENGATGSNNIATYDQAFSKASSWSYGGTTSWSTSVKKYGTTALAFGGSNYFTSTRGWIPDTSDFCWEAWVYSTDLSSGAGGYSCPVDIRDGGGIGWNGVFLEHLSGTGLRIGINGTYSAGTILSINTWYHIALQRLGSTMRLFINGTPTATTGTGSVAGAGIDMRVGSYVDRTDRNWIGYMDDIRYTWGNARYASTGFPVPSDTVPNFKP